MQWLDGPDPAHIAVHLFHVFDLKHEVRKWDPMASFSVTISLRAIEFCLNSEVRLCYNARPQCCHKKETYRAASYSGNVKELQDMCKVKKAYLISLALPIRSSSSQGLYDAVDLQLCS